MRVGRGDVVLCREGMAVLEGDGMGGSVGRGPVVFQVGTRGMPRFGYQWRMWGQGSDFYLKPRVNFVDEFKVSIHGPNPRHAGWGLKIDLDGQSRRLFRQDGRSRPDAVRGPIWLPEGRYDGAPMLVVRIVAPHDMFTADAPLPIAHKPLSKGSTGVMLHSPAAGFYTCIDIYLAHRPGVPDDDQVPGFVGVLGPITNDTGHFLFGVGRHVDEAQHPLPEVLRSFDAADGQRACRGITHTNDMNDVMWLCERPVPWPPPDRV